MSSGSRLSRTGASPIDFILHYAAPSALVIVSADSDFDEPLAAAREGRDRMRILSLAHRSHG